MTPKDKKTTGVAPRISKERIRRLRDGLEQGLVERGVPIRLGLLSALAGEHLLMVGPPGTAKSLIARRLHHAFEGATYFERLLTRFTVPEEIFGPLSIKGLEQDRYERLTESYLPKASIAFLDEIFKANSAILNSLLTLLNEREFDNGAHREPAPLISAVGASNELPEGEELAALFDRFLFRLHVGPVSKEGFDQLLELRGQAGPSIEAKDQLGPGEPQVLQAAAEKVDVPADVRALLADLRRWCQAEQLGVSDRRWRKVVRMLQVAALTNERSEVSIWDCWLLQHCLWQEPETREKVYDWYAERVGASAAMDPTRLTTVVTAWEAQLDKDQRSRAHLMDDDGELLFAGPDGPTTEIEYGVPAKRGSEPLYLGPDDGQVRYGRGDYSQDNDGRGFTEDELEEVSSRKYEFQRDGMRRKYCGDAKNRFLIVKTLSPYLAPTQHKPEYLQGCRRDLEGVREQVETYQAQLEAHIESLTTEIQGHLWVTSDFLEPAAASLQETRTVVADLHRRVIALVEGFEALPREVRPPTTLGLADGMGDAS